MWRCGVLLLQIAVVSTTEIQGCVISNDEIRIGQRINGKRCRNAGDGGRHFDVDNGNQGVPRIDIEGNEGCL